MTGTARWCGSGSTTPTTRGTSTGTSGTTSAAGSVLSNVFVWKSFWIRITLHCSGKGGGGPAGDHPGAARGQGGVPLLRQEQEQQGLSTGREGIIRK